MSKYNALWDYVRFQSAPQLTLSFDEIQQIAGIPIDHSFLQYKKELTAYGWQVRKISMKEKNGLLCQNRFLIPAFHPAGARNVSGLFSPQIREKTAPRFDAFARLIAVL